MTTAPNQFLRWVQLQLYTNNNTTPKNLVNSINLSQFRIRFNTVQCDRDSPNNTIIRIYNLAPATVKQIKGAYQNVILNAGYQNGAHGTVFFGSIKQFREGRENATDTYLDLLCADGDLAFNQGFVSQSFPSGTSAATQYETITSNMPGVSTGYTLNLSADGIYRPIIRGKVVFGLGADALGVIAASVGASWSIQNGKVIMVRDADYIPGTAIQINTQTGLIGVPEQTDEGIKLRVLLNTNARVRTLIQLDNTLINQIGSADPNALAMLYYNKRGTDALMPVAPTNQDGIYCVMLAEHSGDTRGNEWYTDLLCLAVNKTAGPTPAIPSKGPVQGGNTQ